MDITPARRPAAPCAAAATPGASASLDAATSGRTIDTTRVAPARRYSHVLYGKDCLQPDRDSAAEITARYDGFRRDLVENRLLMQRMIHHLATMGVEQFLDIGTGMPYSPNLHEVAQRINPASRIVHVDNDPMVLAYARGLLTGTAQGRIAYVDADLRQPGLILSNVDLVDTVDFSRPIGLVLIGVLHFVVDDEQAYASVAELVAALPAGSYVALSHATFDFMDADTASALRVLAADQDTHGPFKERTFHEVVRFLGGLELVEPGLLRANRWRPDIEPVPREPEASVGLYAALGRKR